MEIIYFMLDKNNNGLKTENKYHNRSEEGWRWYHLWWVFVDDGINMIWTNYVPPP